VDLRGGCIYSTMNAHAPTQGLKRVYFVRHGESEANSKGVEIGAETPLTPIGITQVSTVAQRFRHIDIDVILTSDMERARYTAEKINEIAKAKNNIVISKLLLEVRLPSEVIGMRIGGSDRTAIVEELHAHGSDSE
jgi:bisphosphoglycerate-dependent phosphoglycerate mutase